MDQMKDLLMFDLHTHHDRCGHAEGNLEEYIVQAIDYGLDMIGISDHSPHFYSSDDQLLPHVAMAKSEFPHYVEEVLTLKEKYKDQIDVLLGVESDFFPEHVNLYRKYYEKYPFDYIIGSVHFVDGVSVFNGEHLAALSAAEKLVYKETYYQRIQQSAQSGLFQVLGHIDVIKTNVPAFSSIETEMIDKTLMEIARSGVAIEINTSGHMKGCGDYPSDDLLERACYYGVDITFGSDAHNPARVGERFTEIIQKLRTIGFQSICYFKEKKKYELKL